MANLRAGYINNEGLTPEQIHHNLVRKILVDFGCLSEATTAHNDNLNKESVTRLQSKIKKLTASLDKTNYEYEKLRKSFEENGLRLKSATAKVRYNKDKVEQLELTNSELAENNKILEVRVEELLVSEQKLNQKIEKMSGELQNALSAKSHKRRERLATAQEKRGLRAELKAQKEAERFEAAQAKVELKIQKKQAALAEKERVKAEKLKERQAQNELKKQLLREERAKIKAEKDRLKKEQIGKLSKNLINSVKWNALSK